LFWPGLGLSLEWYLASWWWWGWKRNGWENTRTFVWVRSLCWHNHYHKASGSRAGHSTKRVLSGQHGLVYWRFDTLYYGTNVPSKHSVEIPVLWPIGLVAVTVTFNSHKHISKLRNCSLRHQIFTPWQEIAIKPLI